MIKTLL